MRQVVCTQDPITNDEVDRLFEVLEALDFQAQELRHRQNKKDIHEMLSKENIDLLLVLATNRLKGLAKHTLLASFPSQGARFKVKLQYLLTDD